MGTVITPVHLALFDAVTDIVRESGAPPAVATEALVDVTFWLAAAMTANYPEHCQELAKVIAGRALQAAAWRPVFRQV